MPEERLQKIMAHAGIGSRRRCEELITEGRVTVDGVTVADLGRKADPATADIRCDGQQVKPEPLVYYLFNKPSGVVCTSARSETRPRAIDYIQHEHRRLYTVGRLDEDSRGLIILTNDGEMTNHLTHPRHHVPKTYVVKVRGVMTPEAVRQAQDGVHLSEGKTSLSRLKVRDRKRGTTTLVVELRQGINRQIRRVLAKLDHPVTDLRRIAIGPIRDPHLKEGDTRRLRAAEVRLLREAALPSTRRAKRPSPVRPKRANPNRPQPAERRRRK